MKHIKPRREYLDAPFEQETLPNDPMSLLEQWLEVAEKAAVDLPNAMTIATVSAQGHPSVRNVLLKGLDDGMIFFYTDYGSTKARAIEDNPRVALNLYWAPMDRQISIEGTAVRCSRERSEAYFHSRPRQSQLSAYISNQTREVESRAELEAKYNAAKLEFEGKTIPCKPDWGGYQVTPVEFIFWQGRPNRLHDRFRYRLEQSGEWQIRRLSP